jgi:rRNA processing protein Krr1/Pno1
MAENGNGAVEQPPVAQESSTTKSGDGQMKYADAFPGLGGTAPAAAKKPNWMNTKNKMSIGKPSGARAAPGSNNAANIVKTVTIPRSERRMKNDHVGQSEMRKNCADVSRKTSTKISYSVNKDESIHVIVQGKNSKAVDTACNQIKGQLAEQGMLEVQIPKQYHRFILGKQGAKLRALEESTGTRIRIPGPSDDDDKIKISGPKEGVQSARASIMSIARTQNDRGNEKIDMPKEYHPFIRGRKDEIIANCSSQGSVSINVPPPSKDATEISIIGDKKAVMLAKTFVDDIYKKKKDKCTEVSVEIPKSQHRYVIGPKGSCIQEIFRVHDVIVEVPPPDSPESCMSITLRGEPAHLGPALNEVYLKANSYNTQVLSAPQWCRPKFVGPKGANIKKLQEQFKQVKIDIKQDSDKIEVSGPLEEVDEAAKVIKQVIKDILTNFTVKEVKVAQVHHGRIIGNKGANLKAYQEKYENLNVRLPDQKETDASKKDIIRIEGRPEDVAEVYKELSEQAAKYANEANETVEFEQKYHKYFFQKADFNNPNSKDKIGVIRSKYPDTLSIQFPDRNSNSNKITVRGPKQFVAGSIKDMTKLYEEIVANNYTGSVLIMKQFHRNIIGKGGQNINKLKDEFECQIDIPDPNDESQLIKITGKKPMVEKVRQRLRKMESEQANITEESLTISQKLHSQLIGKKGAQINELRSKYTVLIQFPEKSEKSDAVLIRGASDQVKAAKAELSAIAAIKLEEGYTESVECPAEHIKFMIGKGGATKNELQSQYDVTLILPSKDSSDCSLTILGKQANVKKARRGRAPPREAQDVQGDHRRRAEKVPRELCEARQERQHLEHSAGELCGHADQGAAAG